MATKNRKTAEELDPVDETISEEMTPEEAEQMKILQLLEEGKYKEEPYFYSGGFYVVEEDDDPGFYPIKLRWWDAGPCSGGTIIHVCVYVGDVVFEYDGWEWTSENFKEIIEPVEDWLDENTKTDFRDVYEQCAVALRTKEDAEELLPDADYYDFGGDLYRFVAPREDLENIPEEELTEEQKELLELERSKTPLTREEAVAMFFGGSYEIDTDY